MATPFSQNTKARNRLRYEILRYNRLYPLFGALCLPGRVVIFALAFLLLIASSPLVVIGPDAPLPPVPSATQTQVPLPPTAIPTAVQTVVATKDTEGAGSMPSSYCLWPGDTLTAVAQAAQVDLSNVEAFNPDVTAFAGSTIHLPPGSLPPDRWPLPTREADNLPFGNSGYYIGADNLHKRVALTFDIGYVPENRDRMVWLHEQGIQATFFVMGVSIARHPNVVADVLDNGHVLGNHSWDHLNFQQLSVDEIKAQLQKTEDAVQAANAAASTLPYLRAPFGAIDWRVREIAGQMGYSIIGWTVDSHDWIDGTTADQVVEQVTRQVCPGAIIIMHDANPANTLALPRIITYLRDNGYEIVPLAELLGF